jgi:hypothetical protein
MEIGERPEVYDWALDGGVKAGVPVGGECVAGLFMEELAEVLATVWLGGSCVGGECVVR